MHVCLFDAGCMVHSVEYDHTASIEATPLSLNYSSPPRIIKKTVNGAMWQDIYTDYIIF
jgi:hypothetical protein